MKYYVYEVLGKNKELLYIGKGADKRYLSHLNGASSNKNINRYYFNNGEGDCLSANILKHFDCEKEAFEFEQVLINETNPLCNVTGRLDVSIVDKKTLGKKQNFKELAEDYYTHYIRLNGCNTGGVNYTIEQVQELQQRIESIQNVCPRLVDYADELGVDELRSCGYQESKIKRKYLSSVGATKLISSPARIHKILKLKVGDRHTYKELKGMLTDAYSKLKVIKTAKAKDIEKFYHVKRTNINGSSGYKIIGEA